MVPAPSVLISLAPRTGDDVPALRGRLEDTLRDCGFASRFSADPRETMDWVQSQRFAASFLDSALEVGGDGPVWRALQPVLRRRIVLMTRGPRRDLWFEALTQGVATVLALPPRRLAVRAAIAAALGPEPDSTP